MLNLELPSTTAGGAPYAGGTPLLLNQKRLTVTTAQIAAGGTLLFPGYPVNMLVKVNSPEASVTAPTNPFLWNIFYTFSPGASEPLTLDFNGGITYELLKVFGGYTNPTYGNGNIFNGVFLNWGGGAVTAMNLDIVYNYFIIVV